MDSICPKMFSSEGGGARSSSETDLSISSSVALRVASRLGSWVESYEGDNMTEDDTHDSLSPGQLIDIDPDLDIRVNLPDIDVNILASDLLGLELDQPDPLPPQVSGCLVHLAVTVLQVLGYCGVDNLEVSQALYSSQDRLCITMLIHCSRAPHLLAVVS